MKTAVLDVRSPADSMADLENLQRAKDGQDKLG